MGKKTAGAGRIGESWEVCDLGSEQSIVAVGPENGRTLTEIVRLWGSGLIGQAKLTDGGFPLLIKFLDAAEPLSVQVHPSSEVASQSAERIPYKHEAWYVIEAQPGACIYRGVKPGVEVKELKAALSEHRLVEALDCLPARPGHAFYLPSGTIHALGGGILAAEVQTPSDITYRLFDWDRVDSSTGRPRELHIEQALASATLEPVDPVHEGQQHVASLWTTVTSLIRCDSFVIERVRMAAGVEQVIPYEEMVIWIVLEGNGSIACEGIREAIPFGTGDTVLLPAGMHDARVRTHDCCLWLEVSVPVASSLSGFERPKRESPRGDGPGETFVPLTVPHNGT
ncbi:MAG: class I mannose-6-phosphate isomerase [Planctomycetes bacterium]|nr:class I mannose-6-phosphate isomerase [Planctomycetota bacterium]